VIVLDSSAMVAIFRREPDAELFATAVASAARVCTSALIVFETRTVLGKGRPMPIVDDFNTWLGAQDVEIFPFDAAMAAAAFAAYSRYGKGVHPKARLGLCDCAVYALAKSLNAPLLFKGADFSHTDVTAAV